VSYGETVAVELTTKGIVQPDAVSMVTRGVIAPFAGPPPPPPVPVHGHGGGESYFEKLIRLDLLEMVNTPATLIKEPAVVDLRPASLELLIGRLEDAAEIASTERTMLQDAMTQLGQLRSLISMEHGQLQFERNALRQEISEKFAALEYQRAELAYSVDTLRMMQAPVDDHEVTKKIMIGAAVVVGAVVLLALLLYLRPPK
jgi:hypothetical protein